jgi:hypothetical protein
MKENDLHDVLTRYENAVGCVERDDDTSEEAMAELKEARSSLLKLLIQAQVQLDY